MASTLRPTRLQGHDFLSALANELLLLVGSSSESTNSPDEHLALLCALSSTSRRMNDMFDRELYRFNIRKQGGSVMSWAAFKNHVDILEKAIAYGAPLEADGQHREARLAILEKIPFRDAENLLLAMSRYFRQ